MQADRNAVESQSDALQETCTRQAHEIQTLGETVAVFRKGVHALSVENARLRGEVGTVRALATHARSPALDTELTEVRLKPDARAPAAARAVVDRFLSDRVPCGMLDRVKIILSELLADSVREAGASTGQPLVVRIERSPTDVRLEILDPGRLGAVVPLERAYSIGLEVTQALSESWGGERDPVQGTRTWAQLTLTSAIG